MAEYTITDVQIELSADNKTVLVVANLRRNAVTFHALSVNYPATRSSADLIDKVVAVAHRIIEAERIKRQGIARAITALEGRVL